MYDVIYRDSRSVGSRYESNGHTQTVRQYKQHEAWLSGNESFLNPTFNIPMLLIYLCVSVCLSVAFKFSEPCD